MKSFSLLAGSDLAISCGVKFVFGFLGASWFAASIFSFMLVVRSAHFARDETVGAGSSPFS